jgi:hypothetical protein
MHDPDAQSANTATRAAAVGAAATGSAWTTLSSLHTTGAPFLTRLSRAAVTALAPVAHLEPRLGECDHRRVHEQERDARAAALSGNARVAAASTAGAAASTARIAATTTTATLSGCAVFTRGARCGDPRRALEFAVG